MNEKFLKYVITKVQDEKCTEHEKKASFKIKGQVIVISDTCCNEFYQNMSDKIQDQINQEMFKI